MKRFKNRLTKYCVWLCSTALAISLTIAAPRAQQPPATTPQSSEDRIALYQALLDLTNPWTVMCVAAHPDDEDGTSLIVMRRKYGAHTVSLFSTFGEGGQNAIGPELYEELGAIRARETMAASEIQGSEPYFLGLKDFGFSKSRDETFQKWGHEEALRRMVLQIRKLRPDVIITNHSTTSNDHGHHQATALLVVEAFDAAADPNRFPEQLKDGVTTWQVQRLFVRQRGAAQQNPDRQGGGPPIVTIDPNERDPIRGTIFAEQALSALQKHATQGPWPKTFAEFTARFRTFSGQGGATGQMPLIRYRLEREAKGGEALPKESHNFLDGLKLSEWAETAVAAPTIDGEPLCKFYDAPPRVLSAMIQARSKGYLRNTLPFKTSEPHVRQQVGRVNTAIAIAAGLRLKVGVSEPLVPGQAAQVSVTLENRGTSNVRIDSIAANVANSRIKIAESVTLPSGSSIAPKGDFVVPPNTAMNLPQPAHLYDGESFGQRMDTVASLKIAGETLWLFENQDVDVGPTLEITRIDPSPLVVTPQNATTQLPLRVTVVNHGRGESQLTVKASESAGGRKTLVAQTSMALAANERRELNLNPKLNLTRLLQTASHHLAESARLQVTFQAGPRVLATTEVPLIMADARTAPTLAVGYIRGFDFSLPNALSSLGVESKELSVDDVKTSDLSKFTSVIVDNRVYESQPELIAANQKLLDYAQAGGNLIVFYHKNDEWNPDPRRNRPQLAPYKLILGNERITDENAPITFLEPDHPLLNLPNKLNQDDFKDWVQERGLYYPREWDPQFHALLQSNDPNEQPLKGGLLVADYGRGHYIYTSMVWYRQLRAGVPGAYRMLANMISYGRN